MEDDYYSAMGIGSEGKSGSENMLIGEGDNPNFSYGYDYMSTGAPESMKTVTPYVNVVGKGSGGGRAGGPRAPDDGKVPKKVPKKSAYERYMESQGEYINGVWWPKYVKGKDGKYIEQTKPDTSDPTSKYYKPPEKNISPKKTSDSDADTHISTKSDSPDEEPFIVTGGAETSMFGNTIGLIPANSPTQLAAYNYVKSTPGLGDEQDEKPISIFDIPQPLSEMEILRLSL